MINSEIRNKLKTLTGYLKLRDCPSTPNHYREFILFALSDLYRNIINDNAINPLMIIEEASSPRPDYLLGALSSFICGIKKHRQFSAKELADMAISAGVKRLPGSSDFVLGAFRAEAEVDIIRLESFGISRLKTVDGMLRVYSLKNKIDKFTRGRYFDVKIDSYSYITHEHREYEKLEKHAELLDIKKMIGDLRNDEETNEEKIERFETEYMLKYHKHKGTSSKPSQDKIIKEIIKNPNARLTIYLTGKKLVSFVDHEFKRFYSNKKVGLLEICDLIQTLHTVHPFDDYNGRTICVALLNTLLINYGYPISLQFDQSTAVGCSLQEYARYVATGCIAMYYLCHPAIVKTHKQAFDFISILIEIQARSCFNQHRPIYNESLIISIARNPSQYLKSKTYLQTLCRNFKVEDIEDPLHHIEKYRVASKRRF
ncbi:hypothetical protein [Piscirickettsia litoralis]|uniref:Fido domain-containing protein n=1 Tax=Piscirickettsia litoralis TaxID=1891921 RepID=A0ABX2ZYJ2_9GAMM|nr:hypothetical protein [Piscirickettsia litoralis]ODN41578.1 hypothetical protein BGC07_15860 [Piscirickettsia litoralis]